MPEVKRFLLELVDLESQEVLETKTVSREEWEAEWKYEVGTEYKDSDSPNKWKGWTVSSIGLETLR